MDSYNYYFFDLDGTISESAPGILKAVKYGLDQAGIHEEDAEKLHSFIGPPLNVQMKKLYGMTDEQIVTAVTAFRKLYEDEGGLYDCEAYDGIGDLLYDLKKEGKVLAVASSKPEPFVRKIIDRFGFTDAFDVICGSGIGDELTKKASRGQKAEIIHKAMGQLSGNGNAESLKWMEDIGFLLEEGYRFGDNDYERQPYVSPRSIRQEQEKQNQTA